MPDAVPAPFAAEPRSDRWGSVSLGTSKGHSRPNSLGLLLVLCLTGLLPVRYVKGAVEERFEFHERRMGTEFRIILYASEPAEARRAAWLAFQRAEELEQILSGYREESELRRAEEAASERPVVLSRELFRVLRLALVLAYTTDGAFDPTVKPLAEVWKRTISEGRLPGRDELAEARGRVGYRNVWLNSRTRALRFGRPDVTVDLGGLGKGFAAEEMWRILHDLGQPRSLVDAGGDLRLGSPPPGREAWRVELEDGLAGPKILYLRDCAVATSGDGRQAVEIQGRRYSHLVDPRSGDALPYRVTACVVAPDGALADGLATALSLVEEARLGEIVSSWKGVEARVVREEEGRIQQWQSVGFADLTRRK